MAAFDEINLESIKPLLDDPDFESAYTTGKNLAGKIDGLLVARKLTIGTLEELQKDVAESYDISRQAKIGGAVAAITGSTLGIIGFGLSFVTFGASLGLLIPGALIGAAGGVTLAGAEIGYQVVASQAFKAAKLACEQDRQLLLEVKELNDKFFKDIKNLAGKHRTTQENILKYLNLARSLGRGAYCSYKGIDAIFEIGRTGFAAARVAGSLGRTVWATASTAARVVGIAAVVFDVALLPVDLAIMFKAAHDVHTYKTTGKSKSNVANEIAELLEKLKENRKEMEKFQHGSN